MSFADNDNGNIISFSLRSCVADATTVPYNPYPDIDPDIVLKSPMGNMDTVIVIGYTKDGDEYFASSKADGGEIIWLLERMKLRLLTVFED